MSQPEQSSRMAVLLFTDMVDSVAMERRLGTEAYSELLKVHHQLFRQALEVIGAGKIHLDTGDGLLSEFSTAADAVNVALLFQTFLREQKWGTAGPKVRIGLHQGQLAEIRLDPSLPGKIVGIPVSIAARVMNVAQAGQILMTRPVHDDARQFIRQHPISRIPGRSVPPLRWKAHGSYLFKGSDEATEIFEVGASGLAPLSAPPDSEKGHRVGPAEEQMPVRKRAAIGAGIAVVAGLALWSMPAGDPWVNASYDWLFRFSTSMPAIPAKKMVLIFMDNDSYRVLGQTRGNWDRKLHADLLAKLSGSRLVVFDLFFERLRGSNDVALAEAMKKHGRVVFMTRRHDPKQPIGPSTQVIPPDKLFLEAATNCGIGEVELATLPRRHWPFPAPRDERYQSLPWTAARIAGATLNDRPEEQWLRYYGDGEEEPWEPMGYYFALSNSASHFDDRIVLIGNKPASLDPNVPDDDKFRNPYTHQTGEAVGGVEILATTFLNLLNRDWLRRPSAAIEALLLILTGVMVGGGFCYANRAVALGLAAISALAITLMGVSLSHFTNYWFPWLIVSGGQVPCALAWALLPATVLAKSRTIPKRQKLSPTIPPAAPPQSGLPDAPEYELFDPPFGEGGFGKVWLVRNAIGQWQALKAIYQAKFGDNVGPYEAEFNGLQKYKPVSERHAGLLRVDLISRKKDEGYFYYVMELGDSLTPGWEKSPERYKPRDLEGARKQAHGRRLPAAECVRIGVVLTDALDFLHREGLTHRDIKPSNIIFVQGRPKLADVGLVTDIRPADLVKTYVGTVGFVPPLPERPGTAQADIFSLGMVLYVISTGRDPDVFPVLSATLMEQSGHADFIKLNAIILKACQPDCGQRYQTAQEMLEALKQIQGGGPNG